MEELKDRLLHIHYCCYGNCRTVINIFRHDPTLLSVYEMNELELINNCSFTKKQAVNFLKVLHEIDCYKLKEEYEKSGTKYITIFDDAYPPLLKEIFDPPLLLYYQGDKSLLIHPHNLSVVGTRHPSEYIRTELPSILIPVIEKNLVIVSGLALGVDSLAHSITIENGGRTIGVLAYGFNYIYPKSNEELYRKMQKEQVLLSEYPPYVKPQKWQFPERNRIISGVSKATFVVEAKEQSGSLITSDSALQQNRDVYALPGRVSHEESKGTNKLIQEGAKIILNGQNIIEEYFSI